MLPRCTAAVLLLLACSVQAEVRVWQASITLPTYREGPPEEDPPFVFFRPQEPEIYPYTLRKQLTLDKSRKTWRTLEIENEYLKCTVLPDLGGRIYSCIDKIGKHDLFYANPVIKMYPAGLRSAWWASGVEFNFPLGHSWVTVSPVDFATKQNPDGSASIVVASTDRVYRMRWQVEITLRPGMDAVEQNVTLSNPTAVRHRYYWWNNAEIPAFEDTRFYLPCHATSTHSHADLDSWPVNSDGVDMSRLANHQGGGLARFGIGCREPFMGVYSPQDGSGIGHFADVSVVPGKKIWSWGSPKSRADAAKALTDNGSEYVEIQAGLFQDQETYGLLDPQQSLHFTEYWMPLRGTGGLTRLTRDAAVYLERTGQDLTIALNAFRAFSKARVRVLSADKPAFEDTVDLSPEQTYRHVVPNVPREQKYRFELLDSTGKMLLAQTEDQYDAITLAEAKQLPPERLIGTAKTEAEFLTKGEQDEKLRNVLTALETYQQGLTKFPSHAPLQRAAARAALQLNRFHETIDRLLQLPPDPETYYYMGVAYAQLGDDQHARTALTAWHDGSPFVAPSRLELAQLMARWGDLRNALVEVRKFTEANHDPPQSGAMEVALLRHLDQKDEAVKCLAMALTRNPADSILRFEGTKLGRGDDVLWQHLAADPDRVLDIAAFYMRLGLYKDALDVLGHAYPDVDAQQREPGDPSPQNDPLIAYYRGFCRMKLDQSPREDFDKASKLPTAYVFPNRPESFLVLQAAVKDNSSDATAHFLLGSLYLASGVSDRATEEWKTAYDLHGKFPALHANLGRLLERKKDSETALKVFLEGIKVDPRNQALQDSLRNAVKEKETVLAANTKSNFFVEHAPPPPTKPEQMAQLALTMLESDRIGDAGSVFTTDNFPKEKQSEAVRQAFIEFRLQNILDKAKHKQCDEAMDMIEKIGDEDIRLPFTMYGFGAMLKGARLQYYIGVAEDRCGAEKAAKRSWGKAGKSGDANRPGEFAWAQVAAAKLDANGSHTRLQRALEQVRHSDTAPAERAYAAGVLLKALGNENEADENLQSAAKQSGADIILNYLCQMSLLGK